MPNAVIVGTQWGDEGKAKVIDYLTERSDVIIRFQGGANAGHTVIAEGKKFVFHMVPSGIINPNKVCVVANGVVFDAQQFLLEIDELKTGGLSVENRLYVSDLAHLVLPYHKAQDQAVESSMGKSKIGTTCRGIGPAYADKASRTGLRVGDLHDWDYFCEKFSKNFENKKQIIEQIYNGTLDIDLNTTLKEFKVIRDRMLPFIADTSHLIFEAYRQKKALLFEGAQGAFLDLDHGTYPFVTSSNTISGSACSGSGIGPGAIDHVIGIVKSYTTRVGNGPFPTELNCENGEKLRVAGGEFGSTTGRPRRCGWFDSVMVRKSIQINGITRIALTKLDVLNDFDEIKICTHYEINGTKCQQFPSYSRDIENVIPVYESMPGWRCELGGCKSFDDLPDNAKAYVRRLQQLCYDVPALIISIGPDRNETIEVEPLQ
ncbi:adenylosuccinate synthase [Chitinispirillales bacterium ANBcel5]|uniref:adenylosuccinate synthase n=1 Tax=Cellulosispirillum alkaliphilum TaxID=3039283 RepID=UPI002A4E3A09|nr:adenylosuccinate synthase [Chitinispirillales bacterium ANBcel5]